MRRFAGFCWDWSHGNIAVKAVPIRLLALTTIGRDNYVPVALKQRPVGRYCVAQSQRLTASSITFIAALAYVHAAGENQREMPLRRLRQKPPKVRTAKVRLS
jgi:hypothetical protein